MSDLQITLIQTDLDWENPPSNREKLEKKIQSITEKTHLIILPEMFTTGFTMTPAPFAETMDGETVEWMRRLAKQKGCVLCGGAIIEEGKKYYNRFLWAQAGGEISFYNKRHLFRMAGEDKVYQPGDRRLILSHNGWNIAPFICYDLRFPIWLRNLQRAYDLAIFVANWPEKRSHHWRSLLVARAIENHCFVVGVNRVGLDGKGIAYSGDSMVINPLGEIIFEKAHQEGLFHITLEKTILKNHRQQFPLWMDEDL